jgi:signal peptidase I
MSAPSGFFNLLLWLATIAVGIATILHLFFVRVAMTSEDNMAPALLAGERIVLWRDADLGLSDIAVCKHPGREEYVIGRVVATVGMTISAGTKSLATNRAGPYVVSGSVPEVESKGTIDFVDQRSGHRMPMLWGMISYGGHDHTWMSRPRDVLRIAPTQVKSGIYLLNDNRSYRGSDSRTFGEVDPHTCLGQVFFRLQPAYPPRSDISHGWLEAVK